MGEVAYVPTQEDYVTAQRDAFVRRIRQPRTARNVLLGVASIAASLFVLTRMNGSTAEAVTVAAAGALSFVLVVLLIWLVSYGLLPRRARRQFGQQRTLHREFRFGWQNEGVSYSSDAGAGTLRWQDLYRWSEASGNFLFWVNESLFYFVPRRVLSEIQADDLKIAATSLGPPRL